MKKQPKKQPKKTKKESSVIVIPLKMKVYSSALQIKITIETY